MEYKEREVFELEPHFSKHVKALTEENLLGKSSIAAELAYRDKEIERMQKEIDLLRDVHWQARTVFRYDGVDKERTTQAVKALRDATYKVNDFDHNCEDD